MFEVTTAIGNSTLYNLENDKGISQAFREEIFLDYFYIAGLHYYIDEEFTIEAKTILNLKREPNSKYDKYAVAVYYKEQKLGYLRKGKNRIIANLMDGGKAIISKVKEVKQDNKYINDITINLYLEEF